MSTTPDNASIPPGGVARRLLFLAVGMVLALCAVEAALRAFHLAPTQGISTVTAREYERVPGIFTPTQHALDLRDPALPHTITIDSLGFRGPDFSRAKPRDQFRVLMIGDSYVYGDFVNDNQTFPSQLEQRLRGACRDVLVINAGLGGTTVVDQAFMLQRTLPLDPDLVILLYVPDDFQNMARPQSQWEQLADNRLKKSRFPLSIVYPLVRETALWNLVLKARAKSVIRRTDTALRQEWARDSVETGSHLRDGYGRALVAFRDTLEARRIPLVFAMFPGWRELQGASANLTWIQRFADTHAIRGVNLLPALQASHLPAEKLYLIRDGHPGPVGYATAADDLAENVLHGPVAFPSCAR